MTKLCDIAAAIEAVAPLSAQAPWDNSGWQVLPSPLGANAEVKRVLVCVDVTQAVLDEARAEGYDLIVSHHPVLFHAIKQLAYDSAAQCVALGAAQAGIAVYSSHTALDVAPGGINMHLADALGLENVEVLDAESGLGAIGNLPEALTPNALAALCRERLSIEGPIGSNLTDSERPLRRVALCGGAGSEFADAAFHLGADVLLTADVKHHAYADWAHRLLIMDLGHWQSEKCARTILYDIINRKYPQTPVALSQSDRNPISYL